MIEHPFQPIPWKRHEHLCDARVEQGGQINQCGRPREEHEAPEAEEPEREEERRP